MESQDANKLHFVSYILVCFWGKYPTSTHRLGRIRQKKRSSHSGWPFSFGNRQRIRKGGAWQLAGGMLQPPWIRAAARANPASAAIWIAGFACRTDQAVFCLLLKDSLK